MITSRAADIVAAFVPLMAMAGLAVVLEIVVPWREGKRADGLHWMHSITLYVCGALLARLVLPLSLFTVGAWAEAEDVGLLRLLDAPLWLATVVTVIAFDLTEYTRHRLLHRFGILWRAHRVHHADEDITTSTALRFHPFEAVLSAAALICVAVALGSPPAAILVYVFLMMGFDIWEHANVRTPGWVSRLEAVIITPDLHRLHHACGRAHVDCNFGGLFSVWDRMFGTFRPSATLDDATRFGLGPRSALTFGTLGALLSDPAREDRPARPG